MLTPTDEVKVVGYILPGSLAATTHTTPAIDLSKFRKVMFILSIGATVGGNIDFKVTGDPVAGGAFATNVTGKALVQTAVASKIHIVEIDAVEALSQGVKFIKGSLLLATGASTVSVVALGLHPRLYSELNHSDVVQMVR